MNVKAKAISILKNFEDCDRLAYPEGITRVTAGYGGEALLITGKSATVLYDCGMAYCAEKTLANIKRALNGRALDYVVLSHTHYDHIGALPNVRREWPDVTVAGAEHGREVFGRPGAISTMKKLGQAAEMIYGEGHPEKILTEGLGITKVIGEGDVIDLGDKQIRVIEAKGHTDCSLAFGLEPYHILISSESTGVLEKKGSVHPAILKSYDDAMNTLAKCRSYDPETIICPHYGMIPSYYNVNFWNLFKEAADREKAFIEGMWEKGLSEKKMLDRYKQEYWVPEREVEQPLPAFLVNAKCTIDVYRPR